jgi:threonine dehydrogenase-like Zn-dependent dehydrogenase
VRDGVAAIERASGNERAIRSGLDVLRPRGVLVQLGLGGDISIPQNTVVAKEIECAEPFDFTRSSAWPSISSTGALST